VDCKNGICWSGKEIIIFYYVIGSCQKTKNQQMKLFLCLSLLILFGWRASAAVESVQLKASGASTRSFLVHENPSTRSVDQPTETANAVSKWKSQKKRSRLAKAFTLLQKRFLKKFGAPNDPETRFNLGGFLLGLLLPLIGPLGAYLFTKNKNFIRWAWIGTLAYVVVFLIVGLAFLGKMK